MKYIIYLFYLFVLLLHDIENVNIVKFKTLELKTYIVTQIQIWMTWLTYIFKL